MVDRRTIHTFGDSHCVAGWINIPGVKIHHIGPMLAHSFGNKPNKLHRLRKSGVTNDDVVVFCFGEIDCRCHVKKHISKERSYESVIDEIVANYLLAIQSKTKLLPGLKVCVYNIAPAVHKETAREFSQHPYVGTDEERRTYVEYFNACLRQRCPEFGFVFFDIYDQCVDEEGFLLQEISDHVCHVVDETIIGGFLKKVLSA